VTQSTLPSIYLVRHGQTEWALAGRHTGRTDMILTPEGERQASTLKERLQGLQFAQVLTSPLLRAKKTCELAGFGDRMLEDADLMEWDYGDYEGLTSREIRAKHPDWSTYKHGFPNGESVDAVAARGARVATHLKSLSGNVLVFSHGHFLRFVAVSWLGLKKKQAGLLMLSTASVSVLGFDHNNIDEPAIALWNDNHHLVQLP